MSSEDSGNRPDQLESLIAKFLEAEKSGGAFDRDALIDEHAGLADSLREFFANHDRMKATADLDSPTLPPTSANSDVDAPTLAPHTTSADTPTLAPNAEPIDPPKIGEKVRYFGDYELLEEIARGGMGVVYKARQVNMNRIVALKMILSGQFAGEEDVQRFYTEAEAAASLDHPGFVPIFEIGEHAGQHYFSMGYIEGDSLAHKVADGPLPPREAAETVRKICDAMAYAHERGVIHRDLKPANILIDSNGQPKVTDFGLAKKTEADSELTGTGQILGTPAYMPPEQASGKTGDVGPLADVYSLGAILYCLLTGRPPFQAASPMDTLLQVLDQEPIRPQTLTPHIPQDLETICLKCLNKESYKRYTSADELSAELQRYLNGEPIHARPVGNLERVWRWCKRNPALSAASATSATLVLSVAVVAPVVAYSQSRLRSLADARATEAVIEKRRADARAEEAKRERENAERRLYINQIGSAQREWDTDNVDGAWDQLIACDPNLRNWEHDYLYTRFTRGAIKGHNAAVNCVAFSPDGSQIASASADKTVKLFDATSGEETLVLEGHHDGVATVSFSPDGQRILSGGGSRFVRPRRPTDHTLRVWDAKSGEPITLMEGHAAAISAAFFSPSGDRIVSGSHDGSIKLWDVGTGNEILTLRGHTDYVYDVAFSPDGSKVVSASGDRTVRIWDANTGRDLMTLKGHMAQVSSVTFSPDGEHVVSGSFDKTARVWDLRTGEETLTLQDNRPFSIISDVVISPNGERIVTSSYDKTLKLWDARSGGQLQSFKGHTDSVYAIAFSPDGSRIVSGSSDGTLRVWDTQTLDETTTLHGHAESVNSVAFSLDGTKIASGSGGTMGVMDASVRVWDSLSGNEILTLAGHADRVTSVVFNPKGDRVASGSKDETLRVWNAKSGETIHSTDGREEHAGQALGTVHSLAFSPDDSMIGAGTSNAPFLSVFDTQSFEPTTTLVGSGHKSMVLAVAFSHDGGFLASGSYDKTLKLWNTKSGEELRSFSGHMGAVRGEAFSPDNSRIASGSDDRTIKIWMVDTGLEKLELTGHTGPVNSVAFSPDGTRIVSSSIDQTIKVWDALSGEETLTLKGHRGIIYDAKFSPDGNRIVTGSQDTTIKIWDASRRMGVSSTEN